MEYQTYTLPNGLKIIFEKSEREVTYCGMIIDTGSRDEEKNEFGMAHFIEHLLFKGTEKRASRQIINFIENVGGEMNAYTSKEETVVYTSVLNDYAERAFDVIGDVVFHSTFPQREINKEVEIILDEIESYNDSPSELIFDDFEDMIFRNHTLGHNILGQKDLLLNYKTADFQNFIVKNYAPERMTFFVLGNLELKKICRWAEKYFTAESKKNTQENRTKPLIYTPEIQQISRGTHQTHFILGNRAYDLYHPDRLAFYLLNNLVGGAGMNSLLNLSLREKHGLVYQVESNYQPFTDSGVWSVYFGCDGDDVARCERLTQQVLKTLREKPLGSRQLQQYKRQLVGYLAISNAVDEARALSVGKSFARFGKVDSLTEIATQLEKITAKKLQDIANEIFEPKNLSVLSFQ